MKKQVQTTKPTGVVLGEVSYFERMTIRRIFERRNSLKELLPVITKDQPELLLQLNRDIEEIEKEYASWWETACKTYQWRHKKTDTFEVNFETGMVYKV